MYKFFYPVVCIIITQMEFTNLPGVLCKSEGID